MLHLRSLSGENFVYYASLFLDLDYEGITVIRGINLNAKKGIQRNNGAGKSLAVGPMGDILYSTSPTTEKRERGKNRLHGDDTVLSFCFDNKEVVKATKGGKLTYSLFEDGKKLKGLTNTKAQEILEEWFPLSADEFFTFVVVDSRRRSVLLDGSPTDRMKFVTSLFRLDDYDALQEIFSGKASDARSDAIVYEEVRTTVDRLTKEVGEFGDVTELRERADKMSAALEELTDTIRTLYTELAGARRYAEYAEERKSAAKKIRSVLNLESGSSLDDAQDKVASRIKTLTKKVESLETELSVSRKAAHYDASIEESLGDIPERFRTPAIEQLQEYLSKLARKNELLSELTAGLRSAEKEEETWRENAEELSACRKKIRETLKQVPREHCPKLFKADTENREELTEAVHAALSSIHSKVEIAKTAKTSLETCIEHGNKGECPTCGARLTPEQIKSLYKRAKSQAEGHDETVRLLNIVLNVLKRMPQQVERPDKKSAEFLRDRIESLRAWIAKCDGLGRAVEARLLLEKSQKARDAIGEVRKPSVVKNEQDRVREELDELRDVSRMFEVFDKKAKKTRSVDEVQEELNTVEARMKRLMDESPRLSARLESYKSKRRELRIAEEKADKLKNSARKARIYKVLSEAYGNKGVKTLAVKSIVARIEANMNRLSHFVYPEKFQFKFVVDVNKFDIIVTRKSEDGTEVSSDVRQMSGAEAIAFKLLLLPSVLPLIPPSRRTNVVVLDEIAHSDPDTCRMIYNDFIPLLNTVIPHIILLDTTGENVPEARELYAVKKGSVSKLLTAEQAQKVKR